MSQYNQLMKNFRKKTDKGLWDKDLFEATTYLASAKLSEFHMYSLGLKYYSFLEREEEYDIKRSDDVEERFWKEHEKEHGHDHHHDHDHDHEEVHVHSHDDIHEGGSLHEHVHPHTHIEHSQKELHLHQAFEVEEISPEIDEVRNRLSTLIFEFMDQRKMPDTNELEVLQETLKKQVAVLTAYGDQISLLENIYYKSRYQQEPMLALETDENFSKHVTNTLMKLKDSAQIREHMKNIYPELPMRMHKNKFYGFVDEYFKKLQGIPREDVLKHLQLIKETFNPKQVDGYGEIGQCLWEVLEETEKVFVEGSQEEQDGMYHRLFHVTESKNNALEVGLDLAELLNHLMGIALMFEEGEKSSEEDYEQIYRDTCHMLTLFNEEQQMQEVFERVELSYEPLGNDLLVLTQWLASLNGIDEVKKEEKSRSRIRHIQEAYELTKEGYFIEMPHAKDEDIPSLKELNFLKAEWLQTMDEIFKSDSRMVQRARMSRMMSVFQLVHSDAQEIYNYILQALQSCKQTGEKVMSMQNIYQYLNEYVDFE